MNEEAARLPCGLQGHTQETQKATDRTHTRDTESHGPDTHDQTCLLSQGQWAF